MWFDVASADSSRGTVPIVSGHGPQVTSERRVVAGTEGPTRIGIGSATRPRVNVCRQSTLAAVALSLLPLTATAAPESSFAAPPRANVDPDTISHGLLNALGEFQFELAEDFLDDAQGQEFDAEYLASMMTFDESCWDELYDVDPESPQVALADPPMDGEQCAVMPNGTIDCLSDSEMTEYWFEIDQQVADYGIVLDPSNFPYTDGHLDLRHWNALAAEDFLDCLGSAAPEGYLSIVATPPPDAQSCLEQVRDLYGDVCEPVTADLCLDLSFHGTWCGRVDAYINGDDPGWTCRQPLEDAGNELMNDPAHPHGKILVPESVSGYGGATTHVFDHVHGPTYDTGVSATYKSDNSYAPGGLVSANAVAARSALIAGWDASPSIDSCEEYAFDKTYVMAMLARRAEVAGNSPRWTFEHAYNSTTPVVGGTPFENQFQERGGVAPDQWVPADVAVVPWIAMNAVSDDERIYASDDPADRTDARRMYRNNISYYGPSGTFTFRNVYAYLHALRQGPPSSYNPGEYSRCEGWRINQRMYYPVDPYWHARMDQFAKQRDFTDDDFAYLQGKQDELWGIFQRFVAEDDPQARRDLEQQIDERLLEGVMLGCVPSDHTHQAPLDPNAMTACDWSPSFFSEGVQRYAEENLTYWENECVELFGPESFHDNGQIRLFNEALLPPIAGYQPYITSAQTYNDLAAQYNALISSDPTSSHAALDQFINDRANYIDDLEYAVSQIPLSKRTLGRSTTVERSAGNDWFGGSVYSSTTAGLRTANAGDMATMGACEGAPEVDTEQRTSVSLLRGAEFEYEAVSYGGPDPGTESDSFIGAGFVKASARASGHLKYEPGSSQWVAGINVSAGLVVAPPSLSIPFHFGAFSGKLSVGATGSVGSDYDLAYRWGGNTSGACDTNVHTESENRLSFRTAIDGNASFGISTPIPPLTLEIGVGGRLRIVGYTWTYLAEASFLRDSETKPLYFDRVREVESTNLLSGNLYAYVALKFALQFVEFTIAELKVNFLPWKGYESPPKVLSDEVTSDPDAFCDHYKMFGESTSLLCACGVEAYCD